MNIRSRRKTVPRLTSMLRRCSGNSLSARTAWSVVQAQEREFSSAATELGEKIVSLTLKDAKELSDYLKEVHGIEPAAGGAAVMVAAPGAGEGALEVKIIGA